MATRQVLAALAAAALQDGLPRIDIESVGGVDAARRVASGEAFDLVFLAQDAMAALAADGHVAAASISPLLLSQVAVAVASGSSEPAAATDRDAFADAAGVRAALRAARRVGYSTGPSGTALVRLIAEWGLDDEVGAKLVQARPGVPVAASLAAGDVDLGFQQLSELVGQPGVRILGVLPRDCAITTVFAGAVAATSAHTDEAARILAFFRSGPARSIAAEHSFRAP